MKSRGAKNVIVLIIIILAFSMILCTFLLAEQERLRRTVSDFAGFDLPGSWRDRILYSSPRMQPKEIEVKPAPTPRYPPGIPPEFIGLLKARQRAGLETPYKPVPGKLMMPKKETPYKPLARVKRIPPEKPPKKIPVNPFSP